MGTGAPRDYAALGRGVPPGKETTTTLRQVSARMVELGSGDGSRDGSRDGGGDGGGAVATRVDLLGDRFLRRQVRVLVATAVLSIETSDNRRVASSRSALDFWLSICAKYLMYVTSSRRSLV